MSCGSAADFTEKLITQLIIPVSRFFACKISATQCKATFLNLGLNKGGVEKCAFLS